jgi:hypothetical protein
MNNPFAPSENISITFEEYPFAPILEPTLGEGGFNSGKKLSKYKTVIQDRDAREKLQNANSQRVYRNRNRKAYNDNQNALWTVNKQENNESYQTWKENQAVANKNYRLNQMINNPTQSSIDAELKKLFKQLPKQKGRPKKGAPSKAERKSEFLKSEVEIKRARDNVIARYKQLKEEFLKEEATTKNNNIRRLSDGTPYKGFGKKKAKRGDNYTKSDYEGLQVAKTSEKLLPNKEDLETYYKTVLTTTVKDVPANVAFKTATKPINAKKKREAHYNSLHAGEWGLNGEYNKSKKQSGKRPADERHPYTGEDTF